MYTESCKKQKSHKRFSYTNSKDQIKTKKVLWKSSNSQKIHLSSDTYSEKMKKKEFMSDGP